MNNEGAAGSLVVCGIALVYVAIAHFLLRRDRHPCAAYLLVLFYALLGTGIVWSWGINTPIAPLIFGLFIVMAGILLAARHAIIAAVISGLVLTSVQLAVFLNWHTPDTSWASSQSNFGDVFGYCVVFGMLTLVSWLYNREMERSLARAAQSETALIQQKSNLREQVKKRTSQLKQAQLEEMQQMYRFAELGQLGVTLLHDLANHLTTLTLEVEGIESKQQSKAIARTQQIIQYLDGIVDDTRKRLHGDRQIQTFNIIRKVSETVASLRYKATNVNVSIGWKPPAHSWKYTGDPASICQVIAILTNNAIDAYSVRKNKLHPRDPQLVTITMQRTATYLIIKISDWGRGTTKSERQHLFKPFHSTKKSGLGIGLFIARQTIEMEFSGTIALNSRSDHTEFVIKLPLQNEG